MPSSLVMPPLLILLPPLVAFALLAPTLALPSFSSHRRSLITADMCTSNLPCTQEDLCCTEDGWCARGEDNCGDGCIGGNCRCDVSTLCPDLRQCCSKHGFCGYDAAHCGAGCQGGNCCPNGKCPPNIIQWSGYDWVVSVGTGSPARNYWDAKNVFVDANKHLHLKVAYVNGRWRGASLELTKSLGYGNYTWTLDKTFDSKGLDPAVTLGLFQYDGMSELIDGPEIDIEFSSWGHRGAKNLRLSNIAPEPRGVSKEYFTDTRAKKVDGVFGYRWVNTAAEKRITWYSNQQKNPVMLTYQGMDVPRKGNERVIMDLWLNRPDYLEDRFRKPMNGRPVEVIIKSFKYTP